MATTAARVALGRFLENISSIQTYLGSRDPAPAICLAIKADAYGHGALQIGARAIESGVEWLSVATASEALALRGANIDAPLLVLSLPDADEIALLIDLGVSCVVSDQWLISRFATSAEAKKRGSKLHLAIDTGMGRIGCDPPHAAILAQRIVESDYLELEGVCTHLARADDSPSFTREQIRRFDRCLAEIRAHGIDPGIVHAANSAGMLTQKNSWYDMVRPGILAYGYPPIPESTVHVEPIMEFVSKVVFLKRVPMGTPISYGSTYETKTETVIATVSAGYGDGYSRLLSSIGSVSIRGERYPVVGRVCMDQFMVDVGVDSPVSLYDEVILFGRDPAPDAAELAKLIGTISYEITCGVGKRVSREYTE